MFNKEKLPPCPVCEGKLKYDPEDKRWECDGLGQHCYKQSGEGLGRHLMLTASDSGEDADLFSMYPWPEGS